MPTPNQPMPNAKPSTAALLADVGARWRARTARLTPAPAAKANSTAQTSTRGLRPRATRKAADRRRARFMSDRERLRRSIVPACAASNVEVHADAAKPDAAARRYRQTLRRPSSSATGSPGKDAGGARRRASLQSAGRRARPRSPRLGTRPSRSVSNPPIVSNAESDSAVSNLALNWPISVSALTR